MNYPTPELLREMANESMDHVPADVREGVRATYRVAADALEQRGFYATARLFLITEAKALEVETRGITDASKDEVSGWRLFFEGKVTMNNAGTDLEPVLAMESTQNAYATHRAAVIDGDHAMKRAGLKTKRPTKAQRQQSVYILPSYLGVATDRYGNVIGARS
jgi:hypothetical protein